MRSEELKCSERAGQKVRIQEDSDVERLFGEGCLLSAADRDAVEGAAGEQFYRKNCSPITD